MNLKSMTVPDVSPELKNISTATSGLRDVLGAPAPPPPLKWTEIASATAAIIAVFLTLIGFRFVKRQADLAAKQSRGNAHSKLYEHSARIVAAIYESKELAAYFSKGTKLPDGNENAHKKTMIIEMFADFFEHVSLQHENLPEDSQICWEKACASRVRSTPAIKAYLDENTGIYSKSIDDMLDRGEKALPPAKVAPAPVAEASSPAAEATPLPVPLPKT